MIAQGEDRLTTWDAALIVTIIFVLHDQSMASNGILLEGRWKLRVMYEQGYCKWT